MKLGIRMRAKTAFRGVLLALAATGVVMSAQALEPRAGVRLRALDKITGNAIDLSARVGETVSFGRLRLTVRSCFGAPPEDPPEAAAFLEVRSAPASRPARASAAAPAGAAEEKPLFSGWMFASSPGLSALEHPTYDVWVISCSAAGPAQ
jgi:hypothetical protein